MCQHQPLRLQLCTTWGFVFCPPPLKNIYLCWLLSGISHFRLVPQIPQAAGAAHSGTGKDPTPKHLGIVSSPHSEFPSLSSRREFSVPATENVGQAGIPRFQESNLAGRELSGCFWPLDWLSFFFFFSKFYLLWPKEESLCVPL